MLTTIIIASVFVLAVIRALTRKNAPPVVG